jgi:hypothetical protein
MNLVTYRSSRMVALPHGQGDSGAPRRVLVVEVRFTANGQQQSQRACGRETGRRG